MKIINKTKSVIIAIIMLSMTFPICVNATEIEEQDNIIEENVNEELNEEILNEDGITSEDVNEDVENIEEIEELNKDNVTNILVVGQDTRTGAQERSDCMIVVSINRNSKEITMVSLMRDTYVEIPGHDTQKLNAAYAYGGPDLLKETLKSNFDLDIDYYVEFDFESFQTIIDLIGGVDMEIYKEEADYIYGEDQDICIEGTCVVHMDGETALAYARTRYVGNSDYERTLRQRKVIQSIFSELKDKSWMTLLNLCNRSSEYITTDIPKFKMISLGYSAWKMGLEDINSYRIPITGLCHSERIDKYGSVVMIDDWDETVRILNQYLYSDDGGKSINQYVIDTYGEQD